MSTRRRLLDPLGVSHLSFDDENGRFYRLRQNRPPEPLTAGGAIRLRPSDIDQIIGHAVIWIIDHRASRRCYELCDEIAVGAKAIVMHFARYGGKFRQPSPTPAQEDLAALYAKHADELAAIEEAYKARSPGFPQSRVLPILAI